MSQFQSDYLAHELKRWMRPDAHRFIRPDWRRFLHPGFEADHPFALYERKYSPDQPRAPAGGPDGGQWTSDGGETYRSGDSTGGGETGDSDAGMTFDYSASGHHYIPRGVYEKYPLPPETQEFFDEATTGPLLDPSSNRYDQDHRAYNEAVREEFDRFLKANNIDPAEMTPDQAGEFLDQVFRSGDPRIQGFNMRMTLREIRRFIFRRLRGTE
jgi:hypothetical protein